MPPLIAGCLNLRRLWSIKLDATRSWYRVRGEWLYYYRAGDKFGDVIDYYLSLTRDEVAAKTFLNKATWTPSFVNNSSL